MEQNSILKNGLTLGCIMSVVSILLILLFFLLGISTTSWMLSGLSWVIMIVILLYGVVKYRKSIGGYMKFSDGFLLVLTAGILATVVAYFFSLVYANYINPSFVDEVMSTSISTVEKMGVAVTDEMEEQMRTSVEQTAVFSIKNFGMSILGGAIGYAILGATLGGIFSKKNPNIVEE
ncbi:MAG: DUF4199 domain-containing protein [Flavobacteriales bacterium]|nr:DUF4199 domain-containing protein [Flavobacteriales bacterium]